MTPTTSPRTAKDAVLVVDADVLSRHAIADYLRHCGYGVVEAANTDEAIIAVQDRSLAIDVIVCDIAAIGAKSGFEFTSWVRENRPELEVRLAGTLDKIVSTATELCESGPHLKRPYEPEAVVDYIKRLRAAVARV